MNNRLPVAVVFDMDECIGTWSYAGIMYGLLQYLGVENGKRAKYLYSKHLLTKILRPNFDKCLRKLKRHKINGKIDDVIIYTSNTGVGYPDFIVKCLEDYANTPGLFTRIFVTHKKGESDRQNYKNLRMLTKYVNNLYKPPFKNVICFDDRLDVWAESNGSRDRVVQVPAFGGDPTINLSEIVYDLSRYYKLDNINQPLSKRIGDITYFTKTPNKIQKTSLYNLIKGFSNHRGNYPNYNDNVIKYLFIPSIESHISQMGGNNCIYSYMNNINSSKYKKSNNDINKKIKVIRLDRVNNINSSYRVEMTNKNIYTNKPNKPNKPNKSNKPNKPNKHNNINTSSTKARKNLITTFPKKKIIEWL